MQKIPLSLAAAGMVLAKEVRKADDDPSGPPICGKGLTLTEPLLSRLNKMGVQAVTVEGRPVKMEGDKPLDELLAALDSRFRKVSDDPLMNKLKAIYREQIIKSTGEEDGGPKG